MGRFIGARASRNYRIYQSGITGPALKKSLVDLLILIFLPTFIVVVATLLLILVLLRIKHCCKMAHWTILINSLKVTAVTYGQLIWHKGN